MAPGSAAEPLLIKPANRRKKFRPADFYARLRPCSLLGKKWSSNVGASFKQNCDDHKRRASSRGKCS